MEPEANHSLSKEIEIDPAGGTTYTHEILRAQTHSQSARTHTYLHTLSQPPLKMPKREHEQMPNASTYTHLHEQRQHLH